MLCPCSFIILTIYIMYIVRIMNEHGQSSNSGAYIRKGIMLVYRGLYSGELILGGGLFRGIYSGFYDIHTKQAIKIFKGILHTHPHRI